MQDRAKPSSEAVRRGGLHDDDKAQHAKDRLHDDRPVAKKRGRAESGILRELVEEQRHLD